MRRVSRPFVAPVIHGGSSRNNNHTNSLEYHDPTLNRNMVLAPSHYEELYEDTALMSSPTPLPRQSHRPTAPRMLGLDGYGGPHHSDGYEQEVLEDINASYDYGNYALGDDAYQSDYEDGAYTGSAEHASTYPQVLPQNSSHNLSTRLIPVSTLPDWCREMFKFGVFNVMQSQCFPTAMNTDSNMVISAPTGAGKTVLFELAVIKLLQASGGASSRAYKCVYMAPTKAICSERYRDWSNKFSHMGVKCVELTGDSMATGRQAWKEAKDCTIIITTPEKWDSLTRNWNDSSNFLQQIKLFMVDEVHTVSETTRGSCLEVVVSRMMQRGNSVRFILLSATAPNIEDLKDWLCSCSSGESTSMFKFGDEFRPCKLKRHVYGFPRPQGHNDFQFMKALDYKLFPIIQEHSSGKPILVFCPTRKGVMTTASHLAEECQKALDAGQRLPWNIPANLDVQFSDPQLYSFAILGLGVHHAGLSRDDRRAVEELFTQRKLSVVVATSTLAVGVNFPAHAVIVKGVMQWAGTGWAEYTAQDIMQMLGRAGRPQFDREGIAIIMCEKQLETKYSLLSTGGSHLESTLHHNLTEHINSEIGLGTINSVDTAKQWLRKTLLFRRIQKNPSHYNVGIHISDGASWEECMDALVTNSLRVLQETQLVRAGEHGNELILTDFGEIMSYYIRQSTMKTFIDVSNAHEACMRSLLIAISGAEEFKDTLLRIGERQLYQKLSEHESIRFPIKKPETPSDKVSLLIQAVLGGVPLMSNEFKSLNSQPHMEALNVMRHAPRMIAALVDTALTTKNGGVILSGTSLWVNPESSMRSLNAKVWEDRPAVLKQFEGIGDKSFKVLAENGIATIKSLSTEDPGRIEMLLNRRSPFGSDLISAARSLPRYSISMMETSIATNHAKGTVDVIVSITISVKLPQGKANRFTQHSDTRGSSILTTLSDNQYVDFRRIGTKALLDSAKFSVTASLTKPSQTIVVLVSPVKFAGITERLDFKPSIPAKSFPTLNTRPLKESEYLNISGDTIKFDQDIVDSTDFEQDLKLKKQLVRTSKVNAASIKTRLPNGNYACQHKCKDKTVCRHICCREGLPKPPSSPKRAKTKPAESQTLSSPARTSQETKAASEKHKSQVDRFHNRTNDGTSGIKRGSLIRLKDPPPGHGATSQYVSTLMSSPMALKEDDSVLSTSDSELPEPSKISFSKKDASADSLDSYDNSEMDAWAANIPSEVLDVEEDGSIFFSVSERPRSTGQPYKPLALLPHVGVKRSNSPTRRPESAGPAAKRSRPSLATTEEIIDLETPPYIEDATEALPTPFSMSPAHSSYKPLFQPSSPPPLLTATASTNNKQPSPSVMMHATSHGEPAPDDYEDDIEKFLGNVFEGVKIVPKGESGTSEMPKDMFVPSLRPMAVEHTLAFNPTAKSSLLNAQKQKSELNEPKQEKREKLIGDPMADLNAWLEENGL